MGNKLQSIQNTDKDLPYSVCLKNKTKTFRKLFGVGLAGFKALFVFYYFSILIRSLCRLVLWGQCL